MLKSQKSQNTLFRIRPAYPKDAELINYYAYLEGMDAIPDFKDVYVAANNDDEAIAFIRIKFIESTNKYYVNPIVVYSAWRGYGVGTQLMEYVRRQYGPLYLVSRGSSYDFYKHIGLKDIDDSQIDDEILKECLDCAMKEECKPQPMYFD